MKHKQKFKQKLKLSKSILNNRNNIFDENFDTDKEEIFINGKKYSTKTFEKFKKRKHLNE